MAVRRFAETNFRLIDRNMNRAPEAANARIAIPIQ
jgi:hypothetical protein